MLARVAGTWWSAPTKSANGTIAPRTMIQSISAQTGRWRSDRCPRSETFSETYWVGNAHQGWIDGEEERAEQNAVRGQRDRVARLHAVFGHQDVGGESEGAAERRDHAQAVEPVARA